MRILDKIFYLIFIFLTACARDKEPRVTKNPIDEIREKRAKYIELALLETNEFGWLSPKCDGLLFNSLAAVSGFPVDPMKAEESDGKWSREPSFSCYKLNESKSEISRDMFRGLFFHLWRGRDGPALERIRAYGRDHSWFMGEGYQSRTYMNPSMQWQLKEMINRLGETQTVFNESDPESGFFTKSDYEGHLHVLKILLNSLIFNGVSTVELFILEEYAKGNMYNALYQAAYHRFKDGDQSQAVSILLNENWFPPDRLPTDRDRYGHYIFQRDYGPDWQPCQTEGDQRRCQENDPLKHSGVDLMFAATVAIGDF